MGWLIDMGTRLRWGGPLASPPSDGWTFSGGPATHAFTVVRSQKDGCLYRVDAQPPRATATRLDADPHAPLAGRHFPTYPTAVWEVLASPDFGVDPAAGAVEAWTHAESGIEYDVAQVTVQALAIVLPPVLAAEVPYSASDRRIICTEEACRALRACGGQARFLANDVMDRDQYPEELSRRLRMGEGPWLRRVTL